MTTQDPRDAMLADLTAALRQSDPVWKHARCPVCGGGFSEKSWDNRHTWLLDGESDVHARCCRCQGRYDHEEQDEDVTE